jgi:tetratricopeptide (TPR) repeat protein
MRIDEAVEQLTAVIEEQPNHPEELAAKVNLAVAYRRRDERVMSEKILRKLLEKYSGNAQPWNTLGQVLFDQGRLEEALEAFRNAISLASASGQPYEEALVSLAHVLYKLGRTEESERATENFLKLKRDAPGGLYLMALLERDKGNTLEAVRILRRANRIAPNDHGILTLLQQVHYERNEFEDAEEIEAKLERLNKEMRSQLDPETESEGGDDPEEREQPDGGEPEDASDGDPAEAGDDD